MRFSDIIGKVNKPNLVEDALLPQESARFAIKEP